MSKFCCFYLISTFYFVTTPAETINKADVGTASTTAPVVTTAHQVTTPRSDIPLDPALLITDYDYKLYRSGLYGLARDGSLAMVGMLLKAFRSWNSENETEKPESPAGDEKPAAAYWESDKMQKAERGKRFMDAFFSTLESTIPDATRTPVAESRAYNFPDLNAKLYSTVLSADSPLADYGVTAPPNPGTGLSPSGRDPGVVAGIVVAVISGLIIIAALIAVVMYRHYLHRNVTSMNFDNPVYRKTTEEQFQLEKNGYAPGGKLYPSTVGEEAQEPLNTPATNDFV